MLTTIYSCVIAEGKRQLAKLDLIHGVLRRIGIPLSERSVLGAAELDREADAGYVNQGVSLTDRPWPFGPYQNFAEELVLLLGEEFA